MKVNEHGFVKIDPRQFPDNPFFLMGDEWFLMTAEKEGKVNTMTVGWGGLGVMWMKPVIFSAVRPERYTFEFSEYADTFSMTIFDDSYENRRKMLAYCGTVSGRDEDKIAKSNLTVVYEGATPYFKEASAAFICKKIMATVFQPEELCDQDFAKYYGGTNNKHGEGGGWHILYIAQITDLLVKEGYNIQPMPNGPLLVKSIV